MRQSNFEIKYTSTDLFFFTYKLQNGETAIVSKGFSNRSDLERCISQIRDTAIVAEIYLEDNLDINRNSAYVCPFFLVRTLSHETRFSLIGYSGETIFTSTSFEHYNDCLKSIAFLKQHVVDAGIIDLTV